MNGKENVSENCVLNTGKLCLHVCSTIEGRKVNNLLNSPFSYNEMTLLIFVSLIKFSRTLYFLTDDCN